MRFTPLALAAALLSGGGGACAQPGPDDTATLEPSRKLQPPPRGEAARQLPIILRAQTLRARPDIEAVAEGDVEFRRGALVLGADRLAYDQAEDLATAKGHVRIETNGATYRGPELQLRVQRFEGFFLAPEFEFTQLGAGGRADRVDFLDSSRSVATHAQYTSCPRDGSGDPDWVLQARRVELDLDANEGIADGAVLRFLGVPILALPVLSFPLSDARKSGWLPPSLNFDTKSGFDLGVPYYWNIAPNRDATITPRVLTRRGLGLDGELRYLEPSLEGVLAATSLPNDRVAGRARDSVKWHHEGSIGGPGLRYGVETVHVSDDGWWKDFPDAGRSLTPRLLGTRSFVEQSFAAGGEGLVYLRTQHWQVLQGSDSLVTPPYQRSPQVGVRWNGRPGGGFELALESELNHFTLPGNRPPDQRLTGNRVHALGSLAWPVREHGWWFVPRLAFNGAVYRTEQPMSDGRTSAARFIPTGSLDLGLEFERAAEGFGRSFRQTLEPRLLYVDTPYRAQSTLPNFDAAAKDFNFTSIYSENTFSGVDRVSDAHQLTAGVTSRVVDDATGAEAFRLGLVQRLLLRSQRVAPQADGSPDGEPLTQRFSDLLLLGSTSLVPSWSLDGSLQYSPDIQRPVRSIIGARYSPGPFRTFSATYRFARGLSEQVETGWQWPVYTGDKSGGGCGGTWYGVGRVNYSVRDRRITDAIVGTEYDAGCWIGRLVVERLSTGRSEATTRLQLQLELVGLSRIGSNPLGVLKENIPGYRLLREDRRSPTPSDE
ncbi:MAG: LPS assembly protein LptD [Rubrivivax sp.]